MKRPITVPEGDVLDWPVAFIAEFTCQPADEVERAIARARLQRWNGRNLLRPPEDQDQLAVWAGTPDAYQHADADFPAAEVFWRADPDYPVTQFVGLMEGGYDAWVEWFHEECEMQVEEGRYGYLDLLLEEIETHTSVVELDGDRVDVWDGWHRIGATIVRRSPTMPALIGDRRYEYAPRPELRQAAPSP